MRDTISSILVPFEKIFFSSLFWSQVFGQAQQGFPPISAASPLNWQQMQAGHHHQMLNQMTQTGQTAGTPPSPFLSTQSNNAGNPVMASPAAATGVNRGATPCNDLTAKGPPSPAAGHQQAQAAPMIPATLLNLPAPAGGSDDGSGSSAR